MWTTNDTNPEPQSCMCTCGSVKIVDGVVTGASDETFQPATLQDLIDAEAESNP